MSGPYYNLKTFFEKLDVKEFNHSPVFNTLVPNSYTVAFIQALIGVTLTGSNMPRTITYDVGLILQGLAVLTTLRSWQERNSGMDAGKGAQ